MINNQIYIESFLHFGIELDHSFAWVKKLLPICPIQSSFSALEEATTKYTC